MIIDWTPLADLIETHDRFLVTTHVRPDGDALGSEVGMAGLLRQKGKDVRVVNASPTPPRYDFLDPDGTFFQHFDRTVQPEALEDREVAVILDLSAWNQLGDMEGFIREFPGKRVVIDHHVSQDDLGAVFLKDTAAEATGILVMQAVRALGATLTPEVSTGLLTAIAMDTGWFRHSNTRAGTMRDRRGPDRRRRIGRRDLPAVVRTQHAGPAQAHGRDAGQPQDRARRPIGLCRGQPRRPSENRRDPAGH